MISVSNEIPAAKERRESATIRDRIFIGLFVVITGLISLGWVALLGWSAFRLASWLF